MRPNRRVQIDRDEVRRVAQQLAEEITLHLVDRAGWPHVDFTPETLLADVVEPDETLVADVELASGVKIAVEVRYSNGWRMVPSAQFYKLWVFPNSPGFITVFLNSRYPLDWYYPGNRDELVAQLYSILVHEITHSADPRAQRAASGEIAYHGGQDRPELYYSDPVEVKAYTAQVIEDVLEYFAKYATRRAMKVAAQRSGKTLARFLLDSALTGSTAYQEYASRMSEKAREKLLKDVYRELEDAGLV